MKRFASHYLYIPAYGFLKQYIIETDEDGQVSSVFPMTEEIESVSWMPGVIMLLSEKQMSEQGLEQKNFNFYRNFFDPLFPGEKLREIPAAFLDCYCHYAEAIQIFPFDFTLMQPALNAKYKRLCLLKFYRRKNQNK